VNHYFRSPSVLLLGGFVVDISGRAKRRATKKQDVERARLFRVFPVRKEKGLDAELNLSGLHARPLAKKALSDIKQLLTTLAQTPLRYLKKGTEEGRCRCPLILNQFFYFFLTSSPFYQTIR
jgi:hypothetical protein